jgi:hypothetical protein
MTEFNNRIAAQRHILQLVNRRDWTENLFGLSQKAIERWVVANGIQSTSRLLGLVVTASEKLFFLANKSQEQVSDAYATASNEISHLSSLIDTEIGQAH